MAVKIVEQWTQFMVWTIPKLSKFPRDQRFLLADRIQNIMSEVLEDLIYSSYAKPDEVIKKLKETNLKLEMLRFYIRISKELKFVSVKGYHYYIKKVNEIGMSVGGWIKFKST